MPVGLWIGSVRGRDRERARAIPARGLPERQKLDGRRRPRSAAQRRLGLHPLVESARTPHERSASGTTRPRHAPTGDQPSGEARNAQTASPGAAANSAIRLSSGTARARSSCSLGLGSSPMAVEANRPGGRARARAPLDQLAQLDEGLAAVVGSGRRGARLLPSSSAIVWAIDCGLTRSATARPLVVPGALAQAGRARSRCEVEACSARRRRMMRPSATRSSLAVCVTSIPEAIRGDDSRLCRDSR